MIALLSVIFVLIGTVESRSKWQSINIKSTKAPRHSTWAPYKQTNDGTKMTFSYFTINHTDGVKYLNGTVTLNFKDRAWAVPLSNDESNVRLSLAFLDPDAQDQEDTLGVVKPMTNYYEQILIDIPSFQKRSAESAIIYKQWYLPYGQGASNAQTFDSLYDGGSKTFKKDYYTNTPKGVTVYTPKQGEENYLQVAENGWEINDMSYDDATNILKVDIARPMQVTDPEEKFTSHNFTAGKSYQVMMNWMSLPYQCIRGTRECPQRPNGSDKPTDGTYVLFRVFGEQNKEQSAAEKVGAVMKVLDSAYYIKVIFSVSLAAMMFYIS